MIKDLSSIKQQALDIVFNASGKVTPASLEKILHEKFSLNKKERKNLIKDLIASEEITYTYQFGNTFLERSFEKPARISSKIILSPPRRSYKPNPHEIIIKIAGGGSFGSGAHPTTRLSLRAMEHVLTRFAITNGASARCLDVGTGSGVLVIAAVKLGLSSGLGLDIDPMAIAEAMQNVKLNNLHQSIRVEEKPIEMIDEKYFLITANLRYPTLAMLAENFHRLSAVDGFLVLSGFRPGEQADIRAIYEKTGFEVIHSDAENGWACMGLKKAE